MSDGNEVMAAGALSATRVSAAADAAAGLPVSAALNAALAPGRVGDCDAAPLLGVLAIQGDVAEHLAALAAAGARGRRVRRPADLEGLDGLILPGGESTTIGMLGREVGLLQAIRDAVASGLPVWGTCAGLILLARDLGRDQALIGGLDIRVERNAFGRQVDSFEVDLELPFLPGGPFRAIFIRAPLVLEAGPGVEVLGRLADGGIVAVRQGRLLGTSFHPELSDDTRLHRSFVSLCLEARGGRLPAGLRPSSS